MDNNKFNSKEGTRKPSLWVYLATISALMSAMSMGCVLGWSSPGFESMSKDGSQPKLDDKEMESWIGSCITLGALVGGLICGFLSDKLGRKNTLIAIGVPFVAGWVTILFAKGFTVIIVGRVLTGLASGIACGVAPAYVVEISTPSVRGLLGTGFQLLVVVGILYTDILGLCLEWNYLCIICAIPGVLMIVLMFFMPESPKVLMNKHGRSSQVVDALRRLRSSDSDIESELRELEEICQQSKDAGFSMSQFKRADVYKPFIVAIALMFFQQFSGINAVMFYETSIFKSSGTTLDPDYATIIVNTAMVVATFSGGLVMDRFGRKILLLASGTGHVISLAVMGYYYYEYPSHTAVVPTLAPNATTITSLMTTIAPDSSSSPGWLPILCLVVFVVSFSIGYGPIPWMIVAEITPGEALGFISSVATAFNWFSAFVITKEFEAVQDAIKPYGAFWLFGGISVAGVVYVFLLVPESKGKSVTEMQAIFLGSDSDFEVPSNKYSVNKPVSNI